MLTSWDGRLGVVYCCLLFGGWVTLFDCFVFVKVLHGLWWLVRAVC